MTIDPMTTVLLRRALDVMDLRLVTYRGCLIREAAFDSANVDRWLRQTDGDVKAVESVVNRVHFYDVVDVVDDSNFQALQEVAERVAALWTDTLQARYPEHQAVVTFATEPDHYGPTISVHAPP